MFLRESLGDNVNEYNVTVVLDVAKVLMYNSWIIIMIKKKGQCITYASIVRPI